VLRLTIGIRHHVAECTSRPYQAHHPNGQDPCDLLHRPGP
jgi:hypothetical protein